MTIVRALDQFLDFEINARGVAPSTARTYGVYLSRFKKWAAAHPQDAHPERFLAHLGSLGLSPWSRHQAFKLLRHFYDWALYRRLLPENPLKFMRPPIIRQKCRVFLTKDQALRLIEAPKRRGGVNAERDAAILATLFYTGLRISEALQLTTDQIDMEHGRIRFIGKGSKPANAPIHPALAVILKKYLRSIPRGYIFTSSAGRRLDNCRIEKLIRLYYAPLAGLGRGVTPHTLRRSFATILRDNGVPLDDVRQLLRHASLNTTRIYLQESEKDLSEAVGKL